MTETTQNNSTINSHRRKKCESGLSHISWTGCLLLPLTISSILMT